MRVRLVDSAQYQARLMTYDFDMIYTTGFITLLTAETLTSLRANQCSSVAD